MNKRFIALAALILLLTEASHASYVSEHFAANVSAGAALGRLGSSSAGLDTRWMNAFSFDALAGYKYRKFIFGLHADLRIEGQMTSVDSAGSTNLKGTERLFGLGSACQFNDDLYAQVTFDFLGDHRFDQATVSGQDDQLKQPLALRAKMGYFFTPKFPLSIDGDLQYTHFNQFHVSGADKGWSADQFFVGVALTYHFDNRTASLVAPIELPKTVDVPVAAAPLPVVESLSGATAFEPNSATLSEPAERILDAIAERMKADATLIATIAGHTDNSGKAQKNLALSKARAESASAYLVSQGIASDRLSADGFGSARPLNDNTTPENRAKNRRVEITFAQQPSEKP